MFLPTHAVFLGGPSLITSCAISCVSKENGGTRRAAPALALRSGERVLLQVSIAGLHSRASFSEFCIKRVLLVLFVNMGTGPCVEVKASISRSATSDSLQACSPHPARLPVRGLSPAGILECGAVSSSRASSQPRDRIHISSTGRWVLYQPNPQGRLWK